MLCLPEKRPVCFFLCQCCCLFAAAHEHRLFCGDCCSTLPLEFAQPFSCHTAACYSSSTATQELRWKGQHFNPAVPCCSKLSPPSTSIPAHHAQSWSISIRVTWGGKCPKKEIKFYLIVQKNWKITDDGSEVF